MIQICGIYRQWGKRQPHEIDSIYESISLAAEKDKEILILPDMNVDADKFCDSKHPHRRVANKTLETIDLNSLKRADLSQTFLLYISLNCSKKFIYMPHSLPKMSLTSSRSTD